MNANARRILVVDDDVDYTTTVLLLLQVDGHQVRCANDGPTAIEIAREYRPEVVLMDVDMPGLDGYAVARVLRSLQDRRPLRLVAVTAWGRKEDKCRAAEAGFDAHLIKPVEPDHLRAALICLDAFDHGLDYLAGVAAA